MTTRAYTMRISPATIEHLGLKMYDRVSAVLAELVSNSYDADAEKVTVWAPMGEYLAEGTSTQPEDKGYEIVVEDDGHGMTPDEVVDHFLVVGGHRRGDPNRGDSSRTKKRRVMGRKGIGKLAPFGICTRVEILSSGGPMVIDGDDIGYRTAHLILDRSKVLSDTLLDYAPDVGAEDGTLRPHTGTRITLSLFARRKVPALVRMERELAQRFGVESQAFKIELIDNRPGADPKVDRVVVGEFDNTATGQILVTFGSPSTTSTHRTTPDKAPEWSAKGSDGQPRGDVLAGFHYEGQFYPVRGWVGYNQEPVKDELLLGIRVYSHGKIVAQTASFDIASGFSGEHDVRSYLVGALHCDWLDEEEDLVQTDRRDILWSHDLGRKFEAWGRELVRLVGKIGRNPVKKRTLDLFREKSKIEEKAEQRYPGDEHKHIRAQAVEIGELLAGPMTRGAVNDEETVSQVTQVALDFAPHVVLDAKLREAGEESDQRSLIVIAELLRLANVAELTAFGRIVKKRVEVIDRVNSLKSDMSTLEAALQHALGEAPWIIHPEWTPISENRSFATFRERFASWLKQETGKDFIINPGPHEDKRADFVMVNDEGRVELIEIKRPGHAFDDTDFERLKNYVRHMDSFLSKHPEIAALLPKGYHITLVCDDINLSIDARDIYDNFSGLRGVLARISWEEFLARTSRVHRDFLDRAEELHRAAMKRGK